MREEYLRWRCSEGDKQIEGIERGLEG